MTRSKLFTCAVLLLVMTTSACGYYRIVPKAMDLAKIAVQPSVQINIPAKAHLRDGSVVLFPNGFRVEGGLFKGDGEKYDLTRQTRSLVWEVPLSDVVLLEHYDADLRPVLSTVASISSGFVYLLGVDLLVLLLGTL